MVCIGNRWHDIMKEDDSVNQKKMNIKQSEKK
jgi:hypothetical protein